MLQEEKNKKIGQNFLFFSQKYQFFTSANLSSLSNLIVHNFDNSLFIILKPIYGELQL